MLKKENGETAKRKNRKKKRRKKRKRKVKKNENLPFIFLLRSSRNHLASSVEGVSI